MLKLVRLNSKTLTIKRTWQGAPVSFGCYKKLFSVYSVYVNKRQLCDLEPILCSFSQTGSMGISLSRLTHRLDNLLHHTDWVTPTCVQTTFTSRRPKSAGICLISCVGILQKTLNDSYKLGFLF